LLFLHFSYFLPFFPLSGFVLYPLIRYQMISSVTLTSVALLQIGILGNCVKITSNDCIRSYL
jgi:hypothetical protein